MEGFEIRNGGRDKPGKIIGSEDQGLEIGEGGESGWDWAVEFVFGEVEGGELGEFGDERGEGADVTGRVEGELGDPIGVAVEAANEVGQVRGGTWVGGEVP